MNNKNIILFLYGFIIGTLWFFTYENGRPGKSYRDVCWKRKEPNILAHNKVYILGCILLYRGYIHNDIYILFISGAWIGLHLFQNLAEKHHLNKFKKIIK